MGRQEDSTVYRGILGNSYSSINLFELINVGDIYAIIALLTYLFLCFCLLSHRQESDVCLSDSCLNAFPKR